MTIKRRADNEDKFKEYINRSDESMVELHQGNTLMTYGLADVRAIGSMSMVDTGRLLVILRLINLVDLRLLNGNYRRKCEVLAVTGENQ